jgi:hypothetical protein
MLAVLLGTATIALLPHDSQLFSQYPVRDIEAVYAEWSARGAQFLTPPKQHQYEKRCRLT